MKTARNRKGTPRWRLVYMALTACNVLTLAVSLVLSHNVMSMYARSAELNSEWARRISDINQLGDLAQAVNAPGNDVFGSHDAHAEGLRRDEALGRFQVHIANIRSDLATVEATTDATRVSTAINAVDFAMTDMLAEAETILVAFANGNPSAAGERMAAMDRAYARITQGISTAIDAVQTVQADHLVMQAASARDQQALETLIGALILMLVLVVAVYAHHLGHLMRQQHQDLHTSQAAAEAANQAKSNFLASMSHEIRTPMNGILGMAQALKSGDLPPAEHDKVGVILESGSSLLAVLNDVLDFSKIEAGKFDITPGLNDIVHTATSVTRLFETHARDRNLRIGLTYDVNLPRALVYDAERVRQCLSNLVSNALKFTPEGGIDVHVSWRRFADNEAMVFVAVKDTGIGMSPDVQTRLFKPFTQADTSIARRYGGTGLGLAISLRLSQLMGGGMFVESAPDKGSRFVFTFRAEIRDVDSIQVTPAVDTTSRPALQGLRGARILLTDDNAVNRQVVKLFLAPHGCVITEAVNGQEALDKLASAEFDLVLLDVHMPVMDGKQAIQRLRTCGEPWADIPVIALTADAMTGDREHLIGLGMSDYLSKPVDQHALVAKMRSLLRIAMPEAAVA